MSDRLPPTQQAPSHRPVRLVVVAVCALVWLSALWGVSDAIRGEPRVWGLLGFEIVTLAAAGLGVLVGLGRPREAPGLALACVGASIFAAATLGRFSAIVTRAAGTVSEGQAVRQLVRDPVFDSRLVAAGVLVAIAVFLALGSDRGAWRRLAIGAGLLVPVVAALGWLFGPGMNWLVSPVESSGGVARIAVGLVGGIGLTITAAVGIHQVIGAFEVGLPPLGGSPPARKSGRAAPNKSA